MNDICKRITRKDAGLLDKHRRALHKPGESLALRSPEDVEILFDVGEILVAGGEGGFAIGSEGGGKAIGIREFVFGAEFGCGAC